MTWIGAGWLTGEGFALAGLFDPCERDFPNPGSLDIWIPMRATTKSGDAKASASKSPRPRPDGRRTLLVYLDGDLIKDLKKVALDEERNVYEIVEEASRDWLKRRKVGAGKAGQMKRAGER